jgi:SpoIID/LytB domain protein
MTGLGWAASSPAVARDAFDVRYGPRYADVEFPLVIRVGLMEDQQEVRFRAPTPGWLQLGTQRRRVNAGTAVKVTWLEGSPATIKYQVAVATFDAGRLEEADQAVERYTQQGANARLAPWGNRLRTPSGLLHDHRRVFLVVDSSHDLEEAEAKLREWVAKGERPFLHEERLARPWVRVRVTGAGDPWEGRGTVGFAPDGSKHKVHDVEFGVGQPWHGREDREYHGNLAVAADRDGLLAAVNVVDFETYLQGVVPSEIMPSSPFPALRAQAIAARGEALAKYKLRHAPDPYNICASVHCQVYGGITKETARTNLAVEQTTGVVMRYGTHIVDAVYGAVCGGHSEHNDQVWSSPPDPALRGSRDGTEGIPSPVTEEGLEDFLADTQSAWCKDAPGKFRWSKTMTEAQMRASLAEKAQVDVGRLVRLEPMGRGVSGRLRKLRVVGEGGEAVIAKELPIRRAFGGLRSALMTWDAVQDGAGRLSQVTFRGAGWGHGVGLCQVGARAQAAAGRSHQEILTSYYSGISLDRVDQ